MQSVHSGLEISVQWQDAHALQLRVAASNGTFAGAASVYENHGALPALADQLRGFPSHPADGRRFVLGAFGQDSAGGAVEIDLETINSSGHAQINIVIESDPTRGTIETARFAIAIEAEAVDRFVAELLRLDLDHSRVARLVGAVPTK